METRFDFNNKLIESLFLDEFLQYSPFKHLYKENALPVSLFSSIKNHFISGKSLKAGSEAIQLNKESRSSFFLSRRLLLDLNSTSSKRFWNHFIDEASSSVSLIKKTLLSNSFNLIDSNSLDLEQISIAFRFVTENLPYNLEPHIDAPQKLAVGVLYVERTDKSEQGGTQMFSKTENGDYKLEKSYKFIENSLVVIPRAAGTHHGGSWDGDCQRKTFHIYAFQHESVESAKCARNEYRFLM